MATWVRLTHHTGSPIWVNLDSASHIIRHEGHDTTDIVVATGEGFHRVAVNETPERIFSADNSQPRSRVTNIVPSPVA